MMFLSEIQQFSKTILRRRPELSRGVFRLAALSLLLWLLELLLAFAYLTLFQLPAAALLSVPWQLARLVWRIPAAALRAFCSWRLWRDCTAAAGLLPERSGCPAGKLLLLAGQNGLLRGLLRQCTPLLLIGAYQLAKTGTYHPDQTLWFLAAVQLVVLAVLSLLFRVYVHLGLCCVPFYWFAHPDAPFWCVPFRAMGVMAGGRGKLLALLGWNLLLCLPIFSIPWVLPRAAAALCTFFGIQVKSADAAEPAADRRKKLRAEARNAVEGSVSL